MAKIITPPSINSLSELLELVTKPEKYRAYAIQLEDTLNAIDERLGDLDSKEKADAYLAQAAQIKLEADGARLTAERDAHDIVEKANAYAGRIVADANGVLAAAKATNANADAALQASIRQARDLEQREVKAAETHTEAQRLVQVAESLKAQATAELADLAAKRKKLLEAIG